MGGLCKNSFREALISCLHDYSKEDASNYGLLIEMMNSLRMNEEFSLDLDASEEALF